VFHLKDLVKAFDNLPWIVKLILALPGIDGIAWGIYRVAKGISKNDGVMIIAGIVWLLVGWAILWIIDLVTVILYKKVTVFA
jgi:hypothetical protein